VTEEKKDALLRKVLAEKTDGPAIVYVTLQKTADRITQMLMENGLTADTYHAGMKTEHREAVQNRFMTGDVNTVVATITVGWI